MEEAEAHTRVSGKQTLISLEKVPAGSSGAAISFAEAVIKVRQLRQKPAVKGMRA